MLYAACVNHTHESLRLEESLYFESPRARATPKKFSCDLIGLAMLYYCITLCWPSKTT